MATMSVAKKVASVAVTSAHTRSLVRKTGTPRRPAGGVGVGERRHGYAHTRMATALALLLLGALCLVGTACGGSNEGKDSSGGSTGGTGSSGGGNGNNDGAPKEAGSNPTDTANAYIAAWEANDAGAIDALLTPDAQSFWAMGGGPGKWLADKARSKGSILAGNGRVLSLQETEGTAQADVAVVYDCTSTTGSNCPQSEDSLFDWIPAGASVSADHLTLQRQQDGKWLISYVEGSSYLWDMAQATKQAVTNATSTALAVSQQQTRAAIPTQRPVPTRTPTPKPVYVTAKAAYTDNDLEQRIREWSADAVLFRVTDRYFTHLWPFGYNTYAWNYGDAPMVGGDGTSRQWLFWAVSPANTEIKVYRVWDGEVQREDVSGKMYRDMFGASGVTPPGLDLANYIDSDAAMAAAREHGYEAEELSYMYMHLTSDDPSQQTSQQIGWSIIKVGNFENKRVLLDPLSAQVIKNDF
ncbi:MAG: nuclear transport factor 2 family protein [Chloroflexota bacterium]|nr:nuclear transport factor 2 family protein [Chloroflexota bacterium]MDQ5864453.1 nuclear transport factor 2 family protein [Chloroflexota bacterium]